MAKEDTLEGTLRQWRERIEAVPVEDSAHEQLVYIGFHPPRVAREIIAKSGEGNAVETVKWVCEIIAQCVCEGALPRVITSALYYFLNGIAQDSYVKDKECESDALRTLGFNPPNTASLDDLHRVLTGACEVVKILIKLPSESATL